MEINLNLDGLSPEELRKVASVLTNLRYYSLKKAEAMEARLAGNIKLASINEGFCDDTYNKLPEWAKW